MGWQHSSGDSLGWGKEVGIIDSPILYFDHHTIVPRSTLAKVVDLEIPGSLRKAISIREVVKLVEYVECIGSCSFNVGCDVGREREVVWVVKGDR